MKFIAPTIEEVLLQCAKIGLPDEQGRLFWLHYDSKGWMVGKVKMSKWRSALAGWKIRYEQRPNWQRRENSSVNHRNAGVSTAGPDYAALGKAKLQKQNAVPGSGVPPKLDQQTLKL